MRVRAVATLYIVIAIMFIMTVLSEAFDEDVASATTLFGRLAISTVISGIIATAITEKLNATLLG